MIAWDPTSGLEREEEGGGLVSASAVPNLGLGLGQKKKRNMCMYMYKKKCTYMKDISGENTIIALLAARLHEIERET